MEILGVNKPQYDPFEHTLDHHEIEHDHHEDGLPRPRIWEELGNIEIMKFSTTSKHKVKVDGEILEISNNIPTNKFGKK